MIVFNGLYFHPHDLGVIYRIKIINETSFYFYPLIAGLGGFFEISGRNLYLKDNTMLKNSLYWQDNPYEFIKYVFEKKWKTK